MPLETLSKHNSDHTPFGVKAICKNLPFPKSTIPKALNDGKIETLNKMGLMTPDIDEFSDDFITSAKKWADHNIPIVDIGAAYGVTAIPALQKGGIVIANDICDEHLLHIKAQCSKKTWANLYLNNQKLAENLSFPSQSIGSILIRRVLHFFTPDQINRAFDDIMDWLTPGGTLYIIVMTPHHYSFSSFKPIYEDRWNAGNIWPGEISNMYEFAPQFQKVLPQYFHVMDERPIKRALESRNFKIEESKLFGFSRTENGELASNRYYGVKAIKI